MSSFLRRNKPRRTRIYVPWVIPHDADFEILISTRAEEDTGDIWIERDGKHIATITTEGVLRIHDDQEEKP